MKKYWMLIALALVITIALFYMRDSKQDCYLCNSTPCHAPCLVNLNTGEVLELAVYDTDPFRPGELAEEQRTGYFCFVKGAGAFGYRDGSKYIKVTISNEVNHMSLRYFCRECGEKLRVSNSGYVLLDLQDVTKPVVYQIEEKTISLRCYTIEIHRLESQYEITVHGNRIRN